MWGRAATYRLKAAPAPVPKSESTKLERPLPRAGRARDEWSGLHTICELEAKPSLPTDEAPAPRAPTYSGALDGTACVAVLLLLASSFGMTFFTDYTIAFFSGGRLLRIGT